MTTSYVKTPVGNKLFTISWDLVADDADEDGQAFECADCELLSISSTLTVLSGDVLPKLYASNFDSAPAWYSWKISLKPGSENSILLPSSDGVLPPPVRFTFPRLEAPGAEGSLKVVALFAEV